MVLLKSFPRRKVNAIHEFIEVLEKTHTTKHTKTNLPMKKSLIVLFAIFLAAQIHAQNIIIKDIDIIPMTSNTVIKNQSVVLENGKIKEIGNYKDLAKTDQTQIIEGKGKYLMPGLADMHVHLPTEEEVDKTLLSNIAAGITQIRIMNSKVSQLDLREKIRNNPDIIAPNIHYSHLIRRDETFTASQADSLMRQIKEDEIDFIKLLSLSDEQTFDNLTTAASKADITICGHYPIYSDDGRGVMVDMDKTIESNFKSIEHLAGYIWLGDEELLEKAIQATKENDIYNCPTLDWDIMAYDLQYPDAYKNRLTYVFLPEHVTENWENDYATAIEKAGGAEKVIESRDKRKPGFEAKLAVLKRLYENDCLLLVGGDAGNDFQADGFNVYEEMMNWSNAGIDNYTILKSATATPAKFFDTTDWGTIEVGKNAELIILEKNPIEDIKNITTIETTIVGEKVYNNKELISVCP